jgi:hypothetical protein
LTRSIDTINIQVDESYNLYKTEYTLPERKASVTKHNQQTMRKDKKKQDGACMGACKQQ